MKLFQNGFQLLWNGQAEMTCIFEKRDALVGKVEENDGGAQYRACPDDTGVQNMPNAYKGENKHLLEDSLKAHGTGQLLIHYGAHDAGDVVDHNKGKQCVKQTVTASQKVAQPAADPGKQELNGRPKFFHCVVLLFENGYEKGTLAECLNSLLEPCRSLRHDESIGTIQPGLVPLPQFISLGIGEGFIPELPSVDNGKTLCFPEPAVFLHSLGIAECFLLGFIKDKVTIPHPIGGEVDLKVVEIRRLRDLNAAFHGADDGIVFYEAFCIGLNDHSCLLN